MSMSLERLAERASPARRHHAGSAPGRFPPTEHATRRRAADRSAIGNPDDEPPSVRWLRRLYERTGSRGMVVAVTAFAVAVSLVLTVVAELLAGVEPDQLWTGIFMSVAVPLTIGPPVLVLMSQLTTHLLSLEARLHALATRDALTGAPNRRAILDRCARRVSQSDAPGPVGGLLMLDIDHFKAINDRHGHLVGDSVLRAVADAVAAAMRPDERFGRYGGEEFLVLTPSSTAEALLEAAERLRRSVAALDLRVVAPGLAASVSIGGALLDRGAGPGALDASLHRADMALYRAKASGRDRSVVETTDTASGDPGARRTPPVDPERPAHAASSAVDGRRRIEAADAIPRHAAEPCTVKLLRRMLRGGHSRRFVIGGTLVSVLGSVAMTATAGVLLEFRPALFLVGLAMSTSIPALITPPVAWVIARFTLHLLALESRLHDFATRDALTGVPNRRAILHRCERLLAEATDGEVVGGVLMVDVDHFKDVNDRFGHLTGDQVLCAVADGLADALRPTDRLGRLGGEEFLILTDDRTLESLQHRAEAVRLAIARTRLEPIAPGLGVTVSVGGALLEAADDVERGLPASLHRADLALYRAKNSGRDRALVGAPA